MTQSEELQLSLMAMMILSLLGDLDELDTPSRFSVSLWFYKTHEVSGRSTNHQIDNVLIAQSSSAANDNFEIGTQGSMIEIYVDSGSSGVNWILLLE